MNITFSLRHLIWALLLAATAGTCMTARAPERADTAAIASLIQQAQTYQALGHHRQAEAALLRALYLQEKKTGAKSDAAGSVLRHLVQFYRHTGNAEKAARYSAVEAASSGALP